ncbi:DUF4112 domain-containing protein [Novosphingobium huizhouense]|uniref:DUF4112 domain-containing protein n=1 Tax=Novosphingobium huizhouense TaxID=2866625 RepID=UPI001CD8BCC6|nr:DUF4112 domain-containing protein [Novosphingobium huizhouense]
MTATASAASRLRRQVPDLPGLGRDPASVRARIEAAEFVLERAVRVPLLGRTIGIDALAGLVPVVGDLVTAAMGAWLVWEARNLGLPRWRLWQMSANVAFDAAVGAIPVVGDAFDVLFRSNSRNLRIVRRHLDRHHPAGGVIEG